jgi:hypothetical protein
LRVLDYNQLEPALHVPSANIGTELVTFDKR